MIKSKWTNDDGTLNFAALDILESEVRAVTDSNREIDRVIKAAKLGAPVKVAFRCSHSGLFFPSDYAKEWGRKYGIGLGSQVVSESLDSDYSTQPQGPNTIRVRNVLQLMHPVQTSQAQVDFVVVPEAEADEKSLIPAHEDADMGRRVAILFAKQMNNPASQLRYLVAEYNRLAPGKGLVRV